MLAHHLPKQTVISLIDNRSPSGETPRSRLAWLPRVIRPSEMGIDPGMEQPAVFGLAIVGATFLLFVPLAGATATDRDVRDTFRAHRSSWSSTQIRRRGSRSSVRALCAEWMCPRSRTRVAPSSMHSGS